MDNIEISDTLHNGMSLSATDFRPLVYAGKNISVFNVAGAGIFVDTPGNCANRDQNAFSHTNIHGTRGPGVVVLNGGACFFHALIATTRLAGIFAEGAAVLVQDSRIYFSSADLQTGNFGDGVAVYPGVAPSHVVLVNTKIQFSARAGVANFGSLVELFGVKIQCAAFELEGERLDGFNFVFNDGGGNVCGCPLANSPCVAVSAGLEAPSMTPSE